MKAQTIRTTELGAEGPEISLGVKVAFSPKGAGTLDVHRQRHYTLHKSRSKCIICTERTATGPLTYSREGNLNALGVAITVWIQQ